MGGSGVHQLLLGMKLWNQCERFRVPLEAANVDCSLVQDEWDDMVEGS